MTYVNDNKFLLIPIKKTPKKQNTNKKEWNLDGNGFWELRLYLGLSGGKGHRG